MDSPTAEEIERLKAWLNDAITLEGGPSSNTSASRFALFLKLLAAYERQREELRLRVDYATQVREQAIEIRKLRAALGGEDDETR